MIDIFIKNATVITMCDEQPIIANCFVGINDGKFVYVGNSSEGKYSDAKRIIDATGSIVMPGLVNAHAHTAMCVMRGYADDYPLQTWLFEKVFPVEARLDEHAIVAGARLGMAEMIASGTTSFSDMYFCQPAVAEVVIESGMRANLCNAVIALGNDYIYEKDRAVIETDSLIRNFHGAGDGRILADASIHAEYTSPPSVWEKAHRLAVDHGLVTHLHLSETKSEHLESIERRGLTPTESLLKYGVLDTPVLAAHGVWLSKEDMNILASKGASVAHCPVSNLKLGSGIANITEMTARGVNVCLGTDGACSNNTLDLFEEIKLAALLAKGTTLDPTSVSAYAALRMATVNGAKAQGRKNIGMIAVGFDADLIMLDTRIPSMRPLYDPIGSTVYTASGNAVSLTMVRGKILYENGEWTTIDIERAIRDVEEYAVPIVILNSD